MNIVIIVINVIALLMYGIDKYMAVRKGRRIPEAVLLVIAFFFGAIGAAFGMILFNHKTNKMLFRILVPLFAVFNYFLLADSMNIVRMFLSSIMEIFPK